MEIILNGEKKSFPQGSDIRAVLGSLNMKKDGIVAELNGAILRSEEWAGRILKENDKVEVISFVGGG